jgi:hypothetical protein
LQKIPLEMPIHFFRVTQYSYLFLLLLTASSGIAGPNFLLTIMIFAAQGYQDVKKNVQLVCLKKES